MAAELTAQTHLPVLEHNLKKPGCGPEIMAYFRKYPETGVTDPSHVAVVGDRLTTDIMLANLMGGWGFWIRDGVVPLEQKSIVSATFIDLRVQRTNPLQCSSFREWNAMYRPSCWPEVSHHQNRVVQPRLE